MRFGIVRGVSIRAAEKVQEMGGWKSLLEEALRSKESWGLSPSPKWPFHFAPEPGQLAFNCTRCIVLIRFQVLIES
jgi:hypothetical protein